MRPFLIVAVAIALLTGVVVWLIDSDDESTTPVQTAAAIAPAEKPRLLTDDDERPAAAGEVAKTGELAVVVRSSGEAISGAFVRLYTIEEQLDEPTFKVVVEGTTDDDGRVKLTAARGRYTAVIRAAGFPQAARTARIKENPEELSVELVSGGKVSGQFLSGNTKTPVPNVTFRVEATHDLSGDRLAMLPPDERVLYDADAQGKFEAGPLEAGFAQLVVESPGFAKAVVPFSAPRAQPLIVRLYQSATVEGVVVDDRGDAVPSAKVTGTGQRGFDRLNATTDAEGKFKLELNPGQLWLSATAGERSMTSQFPIVVGPGAAVKDVKLVLSAGASFEGTVTGIDGPLADADVKLLSDGVLGTRAATTDATGRWSLRGLPPGTYHLLFRSKGYVEVSRRDLAILSGQTRKVDATLQPGGRIDGTIVDAKGAPLRDARVMGSLVGALVPSFATSEPDGTFVLKSLKSGEWDVTVRGKLGGTAQAKVTVTAGEVATVKLTLNDTGIIKGKVKLADGSPPLEQLVVSARPKSSERGGFGMMRQSLMNAARQNVKPDGTFELHVSAGDHVVVVSAAERFRFTRNDLNQKDVSVTAGETKEVDFEWKLDDSIEEMLVGVVVDARGSPAAGARVAVAEGKNRLFDGVETAEDGRFVIGAPPEKPKGKLRVEARFGAMRGVLEGVSAGEKNLRLVLNDTGVIEGRVQSTRVVEEFKLTVRPGPGGRGGGDDVTYAGERFSVKNLSPGDVEVTVATTDGRAGRGTFAVEAGKVTEVIIEVKDSVTIKGRISAKDLASGSFISLRLGRVGNFKDSSTTRPESDGSFMFQGVTAGEYDLAVYNPKRWERRVTAPESGVVDLGELDLSRTAPGLIGLEFSYDKEGVAVTAVDKDGPAALAGIQVGDVIFAADGQPLKTKNARDTLRGAPGSAVQLSVKRGEASSTMTVIRAK